MSFYEEREEPSQGFGPPQRERNTPLTFHIMTEPREGWEDFMQLRCDLSGYSDFHFREHA